MDPVTQNYAGRTAVVMAASGTVAGAVCLELARRGARLCLSARRPGRLEGLMQRLAALGVEAPHVRQVDAMDMAAVRAYFAGLERDGCMPDWVFNGIGVDPRQAQYGRPSMRTDFSAFLDPMVRIAGAQFVSAVSAAGLMVGRGGTVVLLTASLARSAVPGMAGITAASDAVQGIARVLAAEWGASGVRVACLRLAGLPDTETIRRTVEGLAQAQGLDTEVLHQRLFPPSAPDAGLNLATAAGFIVDRTAPGMPFPAGEPIDIGADGGAAGGVVR